MDENSEPIPADVEDIKQHFGFLFEKGYEIYSAKNYPDAPWPIREVILRREGLLLKIYEERGELELSMGSASKEFLSLGNIIYFLSGGKERVGGFAGIEKYASPLRKYLDEIEFRFRNDYSNFEADIRSADAKYTEAVGKSEDAVISVAEPNSQTSKRKSIIMAIIFFLCF